MKINKTQRVKWHLEKYGRINIWEAIQLYNATRLSAIIFNLRNNYEMTIENERVEFIDSYGTKSFYDNYILVEK